VQSNWILSTKLQRTNDTSDIELVDFRVDIQDEFDVLVIVNGVDSRDSVELFAFSLQGLVLRLEGIPVEIGDFKVVFKEFHLESGFGFLKTTEEQRG
jgi:hypothetical protein